MLEKKDIKLIKKWARKFFSNSGKDFNTFDINAEIDRKLTIGENKTILRDKIKNFINLYEQENIKNLKKKEAGIISNEEHEFLIIQEIKKVEKQAELEFNKTLEKIEHNKTTDFIEDIYFIAKQYSKMVALGNARGLILFGEAGIGKTYSVMRAFRELKKEFVLLTGHITSLEFYNFLYENRHKNIVLDDVNILDDEKNLNMIKSCLNDDTRLIQYHTTSNKLRVPNKFIFQGSLIVLLNDKPRKTESLKAVESRVLNYELKLDYKTKIKILFELARQEYKNLTEEERLKIVKWIRENTNEATENLNLRLLFQVYEMFIFDKENWEKLASKIIVNDELKMLIVQGLTYKEFIDKTGLSKNTYYRLKGGGLENG